MTSAQLDQVCNDIRARMQEASDWLRDAALGHGAFADPDKIEEALNRAITLAEAARMQLRRDVMGGRP
jgi:ribulose-5-phosphate 4-epimerase/fuculose-1-phosphate aldolase